MQRPSPFIIPAHPVLRDRPPKGDGWLHEVKFDGYRAQLHKAGKAAAIYSKNGWDFSNRFPGSCAAPRASLQERDHRCGKSWR